MKNWTVEVVVCRSNGTRSNGTWKRYETNVVTDTEKDARSKAIDKVFNTLVGADRTEGDSFEHMFTGSCETASNSRS